MKTKTNESKRILRDSQFTDWIASGFICSGLLVAAPVGLAFWMHGRSAAEKVLTAAVQPVFLVCFSLAVVGYVLSWRNQRGSSRWCFLIGILLWLLSCSYLRDAIYQRWESQIPFRPWTDLEPYDYVIVLGGGTSTMPDHSPQLSDSGDRVMAGARLFHLGIARNLVTTGGVLELTGSIADPFGPEESPAEHTSKLWRELGIPADRIQTIGGQNTKSEMSEIAKRPEWWKEKRCALLTSAYHLPRAMKLADAAGVTLDALPSDFRGGSKERPIMVKDFYPDAGALRDLQNLVKEWLAIQIGR